MRLIKCTSECVFEEGHFQRPLTKRERLSLDVDVTFPWAEGSHRIKEEKGKSQQTLEFSRLPGNYDVSYWTLLRWAFPTIMMDWIL